jgi:uncharacterized protein YjdB
VIFAPADATDKSWRLAGTSDGNIAAPTAENRVRAMGPGTAVITVETMGLERLTAACTVTVAARVIRVEGVNASDMSLRVGDADALPVVTWNPADATDKGYSLVSDHPEVAAAAGQAVRAVGRGTAVLRLTSNDGNKRSDFKVTVTAPVRGLSAADMNLQVGDQAEPVITFDPPDADNRGFSLASQDPAVAIVAGHRVRAAAAGTATVVATSADGGFTASFSVTVTEKPVPVQGLSVADMTISLGAPDTLPALAWNPPDATNKNYTLTSQNPSVAAVVDGRIRAAARGSATLQAVSEDGGKTAAFTVTVKQDHIPVDSIVALDLDLSLGSDKDGRAPQLTWYPPDATDKGYSLSVAHPDTAAVSGALIVPVAPGATSATVTTADGGKTFTFQVRVRAED